MGEPFRKISIRLQPSGGYRINSQIVYPDGYKYYVSSEGSPGEDVKESLEIHLAMGEVSHQAHVEAEKAMDEARVKPQADK